VDHEVRRLLPEVLRVSRERAPYRVRVGSTNSRHRTTDPNGFIGNPRWRAYQARNRFGFSALKKTPPMPVTRFIGAANGRPPKNLRPAPPRWASLYSEAGRPPMAHAILRDGRHGFHRHATRSPTPGGGARGRRDRAGPGEGG